MVSSGALRCGQCPVAASWVKRAARDVLVHVPADDVGRDDVLAALQHQRRDVDAGQVGPVVGEERDPGELPGDVGVGAAEAVGQLLGQLRAGRGCP